MRAQIVRANLSQNETLSHAMSPLAMIRCIIAAVLHAAGHAICAVWCGYEFPIEHGGDQVNFAALGTPTQTLDLETGERRPTSMARRVFLAPAQAAATILIGVHLDAQTRKPCPFPDEIAERGRQMTLDTSRRYRCSEKHSGMVVTASAVSARNDD